MKQVFLAIIIALMTVGLYGQEPGAVQNEPKVRLKVVYEKTFDEEILDVIFDTATVAIEEAKQMGWKEEAFSEEEKAKGKVLVSYPKVVFISRGRRISRLPAERGNSYNAKELPIYDRDGRVVNKIVLKDYGEEYTRFSPMRKFITVGKMPQEWRPDYSGGTLYDNNGRIIWEIEGPAEPTALAVSDEGYVIAGRVDWMNGPPTRGGDFYVYDPRGARIATIENPDKRRLASLLANFSKDGNYALLCFSPEEAQPAVFVLISKEGKILWKKEIACIHSRWVGETDVFPKKGVIGCIYKGGLQLFYVDWNGNLRWLAPLTASGYACCRFAQDGKRVYASSSKGYLWCFDLNTGRTIWRHKEPWSPPVEGKRGVPEAPEFVELYELGQNIVVNATYKVLVFDSKTGKLVAETEYGKDTRIFLSPHNGRIFVVDVKGKRVLGLEVKEG
ncbi:MAG TPA: hypothetical protein ENI34_01470 [candidate division WOR-3 bacterium]|uniref:Pyrrolo-quinoline quinone repeat domain-containing protein n=1 Tax=candidate division WOR-3 bacterium TaxID=2052148 RepID=A0A9C9ELH7_UNCW3|nr:hypothetical protein [candidate division WOR-3 bacterium]